MKLVLMMLLLVGFESQAKVVMSCNDFLGMTINVSTYEEDGLDLYFLEAKASQKRFETVFFGRVDNPKLKVVNNTDHLQVKYADESDDFSRVKEVIIDNTTGKGEYTESKTNKYFGRTDFLRRNYLYNCSAE